MISQPRSALSRLAAALEQVGATYLIGGSLASMAHGVPRLTMDVDILVRICNPAAPTRVE
jgi:hypothetical protein